MKGLRGRLIQSLSILWHLDKGSYLSDPFSLLLGLVLVGVHGRKGERAHAWLPQIRNHFSFFFFKGESSLLFLIFVVGIF